MTEEVSFTVPGLAPASWSGNSRAHWSKRHRDADEYAELVWLAGHGALYPGHRSKAPERLFYDWRNQQTVTGTAVSPRVVFIPWPRAHLTLVQRAVRPRDHDNFLASFKPGLDTLTTKGKRPLGIILDDTPECLSIEVRTERVKHKRDECVVVTLRREDG